MVHEVFIDKSDKPHLSTVIMGAFTLNLFKHTLGHLPIWIGSLRLGRTLWVKLWCRLNNWTDFSSSVYKAVYIFTQVCALCGLQISMRVLIFPQPSGSEKDLKHRYVTHVLLYLFWQWLAVKVDRGVNRSGQRSGRASKPVIIWKLRVTPGKSSTAWLGVFLRRQTDCVDYVTALQYIVVGLCTCWWWPSPSAPYDLNQRWVL